MILIVIVMKKLVFILITFFFINIVMGETYLEPRFTDFHNYSPSYTLIPMPNEVIVNRGEPAEIDLYISGLGTIKENKILLRIPPKLLDSKNPGEIVGGEIICVGENSSDVVARLKTNTVDITNMEISLSECTFMAAVDEDSMERTLKAPMLLSERDNNGYSPIHIKMNIAKKAPHGDQYVYLVFTYTDGTKWYQDKEQIKVHVNSPYEQFYIYHLIFIGVVVAIIGQFIIASYKIIQNKSTNDIDDNKQPHK